MSYYLVVTSDIPIPKDVVHVLQGFGSVAFLTDTVSEHNGYGAEIKIGGADVLNLSSLRTQFLGIDFNVVPAQNRRKRLLIADMDSTIIPVECIDEIADLAGVKEQVSGITERAMQGELDFEQALIARVDLLKGIAVNKLAKLYEDRISLNPGARTLVQTMNTQGAQTALVSGGFTFFSERVARDAGFCSHQANILDVENNILTGNVVYPILGQQAKLTALKTFMKQDSLSVESVLAVGDGANDLMMICYVDMGVAYMAKPIVAQQAAHIIQSKNLCALLYLQGYKSSEFSQANSSHQS